MTFLDLERGVLEAFADASRFGRRERLELDDVLVLRRARKLAYARDYYARVRLRPDVRARENAWASFGAELLEAASERLFEDLESWDADLAVILEGREDPNDEG